MNAAETIAAAIEKLSKLHAESTPGPWRSEVDQSSLGDWGRSEVLTGDGGHHLDLVEAGIDAASCATFARPDADLIVTLHRTIYPMLAILHGAKFWADLYERGAVPDEGGNEGIILARAILGAQS